MTKPKDGEGAEALLPLPCPFCGEVPDVGILPETDDSPRGYFLKCAGCLVEGPMSSDKAWVIAAWNRRAPPATPVRGGGNQELSVSQSQTCGEASADTEVFAGLAAEPSAAWRPADTAPKDGTLFLTVVDGEVRMAAWGKTSHVPMYGFCLADQGVEDFDICTISVWMPLPEVPR